MTGRMDLIPVAIGSALAAGAVNALVASLKDALGRRLSISDTQVGWLTAAWHATLLPSLLICGMLIDRFGVEWLLISGFLLTAVTLALLALASSYQVAVALVMLLGVTGAAVLASAVVLLPPALAPQAPVAALNIGAFFLFIGVLLTPLAIERLLPAIGFRRTLGAFALLCLAPTLLAVLAPADAYPPALGGDVGRVLFDPVIILASATYFLYVPIERTVRNWASAYLSQEGYSAPRATGWLIAFWVSFLAGRLAAAWFVLETGASTRVEPWLVLGLVLLVAVSLGNLASAAGRYNAGWGLPLIGLAMGPILPTLIGIGLHRFPQESGTAFAAIYALGTLGSLLLGPAIGPYTRGASAFRIPLMLAIVSGVAALALALLVR